MSSLQKELETPLELHPSRRDYEHLKASALLRRKGFEVVRLVVPAGKEIPPHRAPGELLVQCLQGRVAFTALGQTRELEAGQMLHLPAHRHHALRALDDSALLLTIVLCPSGSAADEVEEASQESFPASDPPSWTGLHMP